MLFIILLSFVIASLEAKYKKRERRKLTVQFDHVEKNEDLYCYHYQVSSSRFDDVTIYPCDHANCHQGAISNILFIQPHVQIINDDRGIGIKITKYIENSYYHTASQKKHSKNKQYKVNEKNTIFFCLNSEREMTDIGEYCVGKNRNKSKQKLQCKSNLLVPDICFIEPSSEPTSEPTSEPLPEEFGEVLVEGKNYTFSGGSFAISNLSVIIRPNMVHSCSLKNNFVFVYEEEIARNNMSQKIQIGNPLFSLLIDINDMPSECPILSGTIMSANYSITLPNIIEIYLTVIDPTKIFLHSDINLTNSTMFQIPSGDETAEDTMGLFNGTLDGNITIIDNATIIQNFTDFNLTNFIDDTTLTRRRLLTFRGSGSGRVGALLKWRPKSFLEVTVGFEISFKVSMLLRTTWLLSPKRFRLEVEAQAYARVKAKIDLKISREDFRRKQDFQLRPASLRSDWVVPIFGIPVIITAFSQMEFGFDLAASVTGECSVGWEPPKWRLGFDCNWDDGGNGCTSIEYAPESRKKRPFCQITEYEECQISAFFYAKPIFGLTVYRGILTAETPIRVGPKLIAMYPSSNMMPCACPLFWEFAIDLVIQAVIQVKALEVLELFGIKRNGNSIWSKLTVEFGNIELSLRVFSKCININVLTDSISNLLMEQCCENNTLAPAANPTTAPSRVPSASPSAAPSLSPSIAPSSSPTAPPSIAPIARPTLSPTIDPTPSPTPITLRILPSNAPSAAPTRNPTTDPTTEPTTDPTTDPTRSPSTDPTKSPSTDPTGSPTTDPIPDPTLNASLVPTTNEPTTANPTTRIPLTNPPTIEPTIEPTTTNPTTRIPVTNPPTIEPTREPTKEPTTEPTFEPTVEPTFEPVVSAHTDNIKLDIDDKSFTYLQWNSFIQNKDVVIIIIVLLIVSTICCGYFECNREKHKYHAVDNCDNYE